MNTEKKQWVEPIATEMEVNGGIYAGELETTLDIFGGFGGHS